MDEFFIILEFPDAAVTARADVIIGLLRLPLSSLVKLGVRTTEWCVEVVAVIITSCFSVMEGTKVP
jgi:hypothetical protein